MMEEKEVLIVRPLRTKRKSRSKDSRSWEEHNRRKIAEAVGEREIRSHHQGLFFQVLGGPPIEELTEPLRSLRVVESVSKSVFLVGNERRPMEDLLRFAFERIWMQTLSERAHETPAHVVVQLTCKRKIVLDLPVQEFHRQISALAILIFGERFIARATSEIENQSSLLRIAIDVGAQDDAIFVGVMLPPRVEVAGRALLPPQVSALERCAQRRGNVVLVQWGEIYLKGGNQEDLIGDLRQALQAKCGNLAAVTLVHNQFLVLVPSRAEYANRLVDLAANTPGCKKATLAQCFDATEGVEAVADRAIELLENAQLPSGSSVRVHVSIRKQCNFPVDDFISQVKRHLAFKSLDFVGSKKALFKVTLTTTERFVLLRIASRIGIGGLATSPHNSVVSLLSGGIDSPVASALMQKRGAKVVLVHFLNSAQLDRTAVADKIERLGRALGAFQAKLRLYIVPFGPLQDALLETVIPEERMLVYRHCMTVIASLIAAKHKASFLVTGDAYGQVASQVASNLRAVYANSPIPVVAPLMGMDKTEICEMAKRFGTYDLSLLPYGDCCSYFLPKHPKLHLRERNPEKTLQDLAAQLPNLQDLCRAAARGSRVIRFEQKNGDILTTVLKEGAEGSTPKISDSDVCNRSVASEESRRLTSSAAVERFPPWDGELVNLDNASTTRCDPKVATVCMDWMLRGEGNAQNTSHRLGREAASAVEQARQTIATCLGVKAHELMFTSGASEANRLALSLASGGGGGGRTVCLTSDHSSVLSLVDAKCPVLSDGLVDMDQLELMLPAASCLSLCHGNNETGVLQPVDQVAKLRDRVAPHCLLHLDVTQAFCKVAIDLTNVDLATITAHKLHGPKGVGALIVRDVALTRGGNKRLRPTVAGTPPVGLIAGFAKAVSLYAGFREPLHSLIHALETRLLQMGGLRNVPPTVETLPSIVSYRFPGVDSSMLIARASAHGLCISSGSACTTGTESHVMQAMGLSTKESVRFSIGRMTSVEEIEKGAQLLNQCLSTMRSEAKS